MRHPFELGDVVYRNVQGFTMTGHRHCRIVALREQGDDVYFRLELMPYDHEPQLARLLSEPDCWHNSRFGWEHA